MKVSTLDRMLLRIFIPIFAAALAFFVTLLEMVDLFSNLWRYLENDAAVAEILRGAWLYLPKCISYALPAALLFAVSFTMGTIYSRNELISILGAGISFLRLITPLLLLGIFFSLGYFMFHEHVVISSYEQKNSLTRELLGRRVSQSSSNVTAIGPNDRSIYHAGFFNDANDTLSDVIILHRSREGDFLRRIDARSAVYEASGGGGWLLQDVTVYELEEQQKGEDEENLTKDMGVSHHSTYTDPGFVVSPNSFRREVMQVEEMSRQAARDWIASLRKTGQPRYRAALTEYYQRFAFAMTPFIVMLISSAIGSSFSKNILLMSLLTSLLVSVIYYVNNMLLVLLAKQGILAPALGAWGAVLLFFAAGILLLRTART